MKKIVFLDRDGTLIEEPLPSRQIDSFSKLKFIPGAISALRKIAGAGYSFVMVTNQDGLGTDSFPDDAFWPCQNLIVEVLKGEGVNFEEILIDRSFDYEQKSTRKPGLGMFTNYINSEWDRENSYVIGDRDTDIQLAKNLGIKSVFIGDKNTQADISASSWEHIAERLVHRPRIGYVSRKTKETEITVTVNLDGSGSSAIDTGLGFFNHMLDQVAYHGMLDLNIICKGDLNIDEHHTIEDVALALGEAINRALDAKVGVYRYGFVLPMDEAEAAVSIDFSGRPWLIWNAEFAREKVGDMPTEMFMHFFKSFCDTARANLNVKVTGINEHHKIESVFKAFGRAIRFAIERDPRRCGVPSTKGVL